MDQSRGSNEYYGNTMAGAKEIAKSIKITTSVPMTTISPSWHWMTLYPTRRPSLLSASRLSMFQKPRPSVKMNLSGRNHSSLVGAQLSLEDKRQTNYSKFSYQWVYALTSKVPRFRSLNFPLYKTPCKLQLRMNTKVVLCAIAGAKQWKMFRGL